MPFFQDAKGEIKITESTMTDVGGNMYETNNSKHVINTDSNNTTRHNTTNSHNDSSQVEMGNGNTYNTHTQSRKVFDGITHLNVRGKTINHGTQKWAGTKPTEDARPQGIEIRESYQYQAGREKGPQRAHAPAQSMGRQYPENRAENHEYRTARPGEGGHPMYSDPGYMPQENHDMDVDPQQGYTPSPPRSAPAWPSSNPFRSFAQQSPPSPSPPFPTAAPAQHAAGEPRYPPTRNKAFEEYTASTWGGKS